MVNGYIFKEMFIQRYNHFVYGVLGFNILAFLYFVLYKLRFDYFLLFSLGFIIGRKFSIRKYIQKSNYKKNNDQYHNVDRIMMDEDDEYIKTIELIKLNGV